MKLPEHSTTDPEAALSKAALSKAALPNVAPADELKDSKTIQLANQLISLAITISLFGLFAGAFSFWKQENFIISPAFSYTALACLLPFLGGIGLHYKSAGRLSLSNFDFCTSTACIGLIMLFFSDWLTRGFNLFQGPTIRGELLSLFVVLFFILRVLPHIFFLGFAVSISFLLLAIFMHLSEGAPIMSDDHSSFIFRLTLLKEQFPNIPFYYPFWNAGLDARDFFATGAIGFFFLTAPIQYFFSITDAYSFSVGLVIFTILPLSLAYATKLARIPSPGPAIAAIVGVATSLVWFRWGLKYGTMGFVSSAALMPMVFVLGCRLINGEKLGKIQLLLFIISISICLMWPLGGVCYVALGLSALFNLKLLFKNRQFWIAAVFIILINLPWAVMLWKVSQVGNFLKSSNTIVREGATNKVANSYRHQASGFDLKKALKVVREQANGTHPLILFLCLPGLGLLSREFRRPFYLQSILLLAGGSILVPLKPQLELDRLLIFLTLLLVVPTTASLVSLLKNKKSAFFPAIAFSFLFLTPWIASNVIYNRSAEVYHFAGNLPYNLTNALEQNVTTGRAAFSGFVLHEMEGGHIAPLATWSKKPLVASSPFHNKWKYSGLFPASFIERGDSGIEDYLNLVNAEVILAHESRWREYFKSKPERYEQVWYEKPFLMFKRKGFISNYFVAGSGEILEQNTNSIRLRIDSRDAILKFNYFPFLTAGKCEISPYDAGLELPLIQLKNCPISEDISVRSVSPFERIRK